jgi:hypothetical protein
VDKTLNLSLDELITLSLALDDKIETFTERRRKAFGEEYKEYLGVKIQELTALNERLGFGL